MAFDKYLEEAIMEQETTYNYPSRVRVLGLIGLAVGVGLFLSLFIIGFVELVKKVVE